MYDPLLLKVIHEERIAAITRRRHPELVERKPAISGFARQFARLSEKIAQLKTKWVQPDRRLAQGKRASRPL